MRIVLGALATAFACGIAAAELPIFDAHLHYSHDALEVLPTADALALLRKAGVKRGMVSSSNDEGTQRLLAAAPDLIVPELRPYRYRSDVSTWVREPAIVEYVEARLKKYKYVAIGEFHLYGQDADLPVPRRMVQLAKVYRLLLHAHSDAEAIERLFAQDPDARILWAHAGFERPERVRELLRKHKNLWADLAFRTDHGSGGKPPPEWRAAFLEFPDRFMVGTDTYVAERWHFVPEHARWSREWLADLPPEVAERIAYKNGEAMVAAILARRDGL
jgi:hypothetical protein